MKIHSLTIQGFGPFKDRQEIDFDVLSQDKIFMLEGPTGSGKSSIIDSIVFALYGITAHEAATKSGPAGKRIRSDYCQTGDETKVSLEFSIGSERFKIHRTAAYEAPKRNGEGTTAVNAKAILEFIDRPREAITQVREVNLQIKEILVLDYEQFSQMVVLPQGDFASFLHASTEKRREVLESIFKTYFYDKIKSQLDAKAKDIQSQLLQQNQEINHHVRNLHSEWVYSSEELDFGRLEELLVDGNELRETQIAGLQAVIDALRPKNENEVQARDEIDEALGPLKAKLTLLEASQQRIKTKGELTLELDQLMEKADEMNLKASRLIIRQKVSGIQTLLESRQIADSTMSEASQHIHEDHAEMTSDEVRARIKALNGQIPQLSTQFAAASEAGEKLEDYDDLIDESIDLEKKIKDIPRLTKKISTIEKKIESSRNRVKDYRTLEKEGYVSLAVSQLKKGKPCPVCGSKVHPAPSKIDTKFDQEELNRLEFIVMELENELSDTKYALREATSASKKKFKSSSVLRAEKKKLQVLSEKSSQLEDELRKAQAELDDLNDSLQHLMNYESTKKNKGLVEIRIKSEMKRLKIADEDSLNEILDIDEEQLRFEVDSHQGRMKEIEALLAQPDFKTLPIAIELEEEIRVVATQVATLDAKLLSINERLAVAERVNNNIETSRIGILDALDEISRLRESGDPYLMLQGWVDGKNSAGLSLSNFVLQERLEMILEFASRHLRRMSNGKYEFRLHEEKQGRTQKAGLGITIMDYFAGKERPAETLSGGETFYASLALALGLVEVVKGDHGGIELGTLFIDEGFGSLSEDTLEEVLDVLEDLREERIIGIISHVEGMKSQIPMRLEVRRTEQGPSEVRMTISNRG